MATAVVVESFALLAVALAGKAAGAAVLGMGVDGTAVVGAIDVAGARVVGESVIAPGGQGAVRHRKYQRSGVEPFQFLRHMSSGLQHATSPPLAQGSPLRLVQDDDDVGCAEGCLVGPAVVEGRLVGDAVTTTTGAAVVVGCFVGAGVVEDKAGAAVVVGDSVTEPAGQGAARHRK